MANKDKKKYNEYMKEYMLRRYSSRRQQIIEHLGNGCSQCGSADGLEIDHVDYTEKEIDLGRNLHTISEERLWKEVEKCQLLCQDCHIEKTILERGNKIATGTHGTLSSYRYCRCDLCRKANSDYHKALRLRKKQEQSDKGK